MEYELERTEIQIIRGPPQTSVEDRLKKTGTKRPVDMPSSCRRKKDLSVDSSGYRGPKFPDMVVETEAEITYYREEIRYDGDNHTHHQCSGELISDNPCECCNHMLANNGHRLHPEDCKICVKSPAGFHNSSKFPMIRHRMLQTLTKKRKDKSKTGEDDKELDEASAAVQKSINVLPDETMSSGSKLALADVDTLVKIIEGTHISSDPKKAAKRARQKEKRIQEKLEEEMRIQEEERKIKEEEERKKREEEEREAEAIRVAEESKRLSRKAKKKNRKKRQSDETSVDEVTFKHNLNLGSSSIGRDTILGRAAIETTDPNVAILGLQRASMLSGSGGQNGPQSTANSNPEMVTIRRHPSQPDSVVTISHKGKSGEDFLYFLVNGQIYRNDGLQQQTFEPEVVANKDVPKQNTGDGKDKKKKKKSKLVSATQGTQTKSPSMEEQIDVKPSPAIRSLDKHVPMKPADVDLSKLRLPPGITITKVTSSVDDKRRQTEKFNSSSSTPTLTVEPVTPLKSSMNGVKNEVDRKKSAAKVHEELYFNNSSFDDTIFGTPEEQFEEVVSNKNRRKLKKAAAKSTVADQTEAGEGSYRLSARVKAAVKRHGTPSECTNDMPPSKPIDVAKSIQLTTDRPKPSGVLKTQTFDTPPASPRVSSKRPTGKTTYIHPSHVGAKMNRGIPRLNRNPVATFNGPRRNIDYNDQNHVQLENRTSPNLQAATNSGFPDFQLQHNFQYQDPAFNREEVFTDARSSSSCSASDNTPSYSNINLREQGSKDMDRFTVDHLRGVTREVTREWNIWGNAEGTAKASSNVIVEPPKISQSDQSHQYNFLELMRMKSAKSPIQRPSPASLEAPRVVNGNSSYYNTQRSYLNSHQPSMRSQPGTVDYDYDDCYQKYPLPAVLPDVRPLLLPSSARDYRLAPTSQYPIPARTVGSGYCTMESHRRSPINQPQCSINQQQCSISQQQCSINQQQCSINQCCGWRDQYSDVRNQEHAYNQVDDFRDGWSTNSSYSRNNNSNSTMPIGTAGNHNFPSYPTYTPKMSESRINQSSNPYGASNSNFDADRIKMIWPEYHPDYTNSGAHH